MRLLILWSDPTSTNLGVRALDLGTRALAARAFGDVEADALNYGASGAPMRVGSWRALLRERVTDSAGLVDWLRRFDVVVDTRGGDSFADIYGRGRHATMTLLADLVGRAGVPYVLGPQTVGPFVRRGSSSAARRSLRLAASTMTRDHVSAGVARRLGAQPAETTDVVFALPEVAPTREHDVLLNVSGLLWNENRHVDHTRYRETVTTLARRLLADGRQVDLCVHVLDGPTHDNDAPAAAQLAELLDGRTPVVTPADLDDARATIAGAQVVIGSRMHACLNALSLGVPAVPLAYSRKFAPLLSDLGYDVSIDLATATDAARDAHAATTDAGLRDRARAARDRAQERVAVGVGALHKAIC